MPFAGSAETRLEEEHLEEVDFRQIAGPVRERHEDLAALPLPLRHRRFHERGPDLVAFADQ